VLDTYASERIPQVRQVVELSIELGKVICVPDRVAAAARDAAMIAAAKDRGPAPPLPTPAIGPGVLVDGDPCAGHLFIQGEVRRGKAAGLFDDVVGRSFTLLSPVGDPARRLAPDLRLSSRRWVASVRRSPPEGRSRTCGGHTPGGSRTTASASCSSVPTSTSSGLRRVSAALTRWSAACAAHSS